MPPYKITLSRAIPPLCGLSAFILYCSCISPTITYGGDCSELIAASWTGGVPHPTGYSFYAITGWIFAHLLPFHEVAWRYNLFSALAGAITVTLVAASVMRLTQHKFAALAAALSLAGLHFFAAQSVIAEVYALNGTLIAFLFYAAIRWKQDHHYGWLAALAICVGLIPNSHMSAIFILPGLLIFLWPRDVKVLLRHSPRRVTGLALLVLLGFSLTLYLPWRARSFPTPSAGPGGTLIYQPLDWGHPATLQRWWNHVSARQYKSLLWKNQQVHAAGKTWTIPAPAHPLSSAIRQMAIWLGMMSLQYLWLFLFTLWGSLICWKLLPRLGWLLWPTLGFNLLLAVNNKANDIGYISNMLFPCYIVCALWTGIGYHGAAKVLLGWKQNARFAHSLLQAFVLAAIIVQWMMVYPILNHRHDTRALDTALERAAAAESLQRTSGRSPALLMTQDDTLFPFWYIQKVHLKATSIKTPWGEFRHHYSDNGRLTDLVRQLQKNGPVAVTEWDPQINAAFPLVPLNKSGTLWLASNRALPQPAKVLSMVMGYELERKLPLEKLLLPADIKAGELFAGTLEINYFPDKSTFTKPRDAVHHSLQSSWIEIAYLKSAPPTPPRGPHEAIPSIIKRSPTNGFFPRMPVSQRLPLIIPDNLKDPVRLQMILPLQIPRTFSGSSCDIWINTGNGYWEGLETVSLAH